VGALISHFQLGNGLREDQVTGGLLATLPAGVDSPSHTVLVVDDDASIRLLCRLNLELDGWRVLEAATLAEARLQLEETKVDVVVLDVHVGSGNGIEFLHELRRERPELKVAMLTGSDRLDEVESDAVIPKPFTIEQLTSTVAGLVARPAREAG
jgi:DNA-binding response OmpR family regulator